MKEILIVEDNPMNIETIIDLLEFSYECGVTKALDGKEAIDLLAEMKFDLIFLDMQLPKIDGLEVLNRIKKDPATAEIPVIAVSAHAMKENKEYFIEMGCEDYISKPIDVYRFMALTEKYLGEYRKDEEPQPKK